MLSQTQAFYRRHSIPPYFLLLGTIHVVVCRTIYDNVLRVLCCFAWCSLGVYLLYQAASVRKVQLDGAA